ncbi:MAG: VanW family protein [Candidatus Levybacteria bacterium]|nr:VanW family protein [Candidatus Levybacteria bacterium]
MKFPPVLKKHLKNLPKSIFWFLTGALLGTILLTSFSLSIFQAVNRDVIYPGVFVDGISFGGKTEKQVRQYFDARNEKIANTQFIFLSPQGKLITSVKELNFGYDSNLLATQAFGMGRSTDILSNISLIIQAYINGINLPPSYSYSEEKLHELLTPLSEKLNTEPVEALFSFENGRVEAFRPSSDGQKVDEERINKDLSKRFTSILFPGKPQTIEIVIPLKPIKPQVTTDKANNLGIKELIGMGTSLFQHSIPNRIFNVNLAASRFNGVLVAPGEIFSFNKVLGDVSAFTGYKQAYVIENGKTVLGDGGGVCQVSTTFFRALLSAGLPIVERNAHAYRVGYYEQDSPPGLDATIYSPSVDLKFKNDTENYILIQTVADLNVQRLTFFLYGTSDGRKAEISKPVITGQTPPSPPLFQDDPTRKKGSLEQTEFEATGATVYFTRKVTKDGETLISERFDSNYRPWQAVFIRGTKE